MPSFREAWDALVQFQSAVKQAVPDALLQIEETENRLGISLVYPPAADASPAPAAPMRRPSGMTDDAIAALIEARPGITRDQLLAEVRKTQPNVNAGTLGTRLAALTRKGRIARDGDGYSPVAAEAARDAA